MRKRILVTNDDGYTSIGIIKLYNILKNSYHVTVIAPRENSSAIAHSITLNKEVIFRYEENGFISVRGTPTDCVYLGLKDFLKEMPDLVISGINLGYNMGENITYSGTVAAAIEGALFTVPSIAVSVTSDGKIDFDIVERILPDLVEKTLKIKNDKILLNINFPNLPFSKCKGIKITRIGSGNYENNIVREDFSASEIIYKNFTGTYRHKELKDSDHVAVNTGNVSITPLIVDWTDHKRLKDFKKVFEKKI